MCQLIKVTWFTWRLSADQKNNRNKFFIMLKRNYVNVHSNKTTARSAKVRTGWPYMILEIFLTV